MSLNRLSLLTASLVAAAVSTLGAQVPVFECPASFGGPAAPVCRSSVSPAEPIQSKAIELQLVTPGTTIIRPILVRFRASSGAVHPESTWVDPKGVARVLWIRPRSTDTAAVAVNAQSAEGTAMGLVLVAPETETPKELALVASTGVNQSWYVGSVLRDTIGVEILNGDGTALIDEKACTSQRVLFTASAVAGIVSPDTAMPTLHKHLDKPLGCFGRVFWTLGQSPGARRIRATLLPATNFRSTRRIVEIHATARALPKLVGGLAWIQRKNFSTAKAGKDTTFRIERIRPDGSKIVYDSVKSAPQTVEEMTEKWVGGTHAGIAGPVLPAWHWLSVTIGVDLAAPRDRWYAGLSMLRAFSSNTESFNIDLYLVGHWARDTRLADPTACRNGTSCATVRDVDFQGFGLLATIDAGTILADLVKKLAP